MFYIVRGPNVWGKGKTLKEALKNAVFEYGTETAKKRKPRFKANLVSDDFRISHIDGAIEATEIHYICWLNWSGTVLED